MHAVRSLVRRAPRSALRQSKPVMQSTTTFARSWAPAPRILPRSAAAFSTSSTFRNESMVAKLKSELALELEEQQDQPPSDIIKEYLASTEYKLVDNQGSEEISLVKQDGDEEIKVTWTTSALQNDMGEGETDPALSDEDPENPEAGRNQEEMENDEYAENSSYACQVSVQVSKPGKGAIVLLCYVTSESRFVIDQIAYYPTKELAEGKGDVATQAQLYTGPPFEELDEELQTMWEEYLADRGINDAMGYFIPAYLEQKDSNEYANWLENVKKFME